MTIDDVAAQAVEQMEILGGARKMWSLIRVLKKKEIEGLKVLADAAVVEPVVVSLEVENEYNDAGGTYRCVRANVYDPSGEFCVRLNCDPMKSELICTEEPDHLYEVMKNFKGVTLPAIPSAPEMASEVDYEKIIKEIDEADFAGFAAIWEWIEAVGAESDDQDFRVGGAA